MRIGKQKKPAKNEWIEEKYISTKCCIWISSATSNDIPHSINAMTTTNNHHFCITHINIVCYIYWHDKIDEGTKEQRDHKFSYFIDIVSVFSCDEISVFLTLILICCCLF